MGAGRSQRAQGAARTGAAKNHAHTHSNTTTTRPHARERGLSCPRHASQPASQPAGRRGARAEQVGPTRQIGRLRLPGRRRRSGSARPPPRLSGRSGPPPRCLQEIRPAQKHGPGAAPRHHACARRQCARGRLSRPDRPCAGPPSPPAQVRQTGPRVRGSRLQLRGRYTCAVLMVQRWRGHQESRARQEETGSNRRAINKGGGQTVASGQPTAAPASRQAGRPAAATARRAPLLVRQRLHAESRVAPISSAPAPLLYAAQSANSMHEDRKSVV